MYVQRPANGGHSVFEHVHKAEIRKAKDEGVMTANQLETLVHPNEYFKRSYILKNLGTETDAEDQFDGRRKVLDKVLGTARDAGKKVRTDGHVI